MSAQVLIARPITPTTFAPFGQVVSAGTRAPSWINSGHCKRFSQLADLDIEAGAVGISLFQSEVFSLPLRIDLMERHPRGSQCFVPMAGGAYVVVVAPDHRGIPGPPAAFVAAGDQPVNIARNTWHGVLCPITGPGLFTVIDYVGSAPNLEEYRLATPLVVHTPKPLGDQPGDV